MYAARLTVQGSNLGLADYTSAGRLGDTACESTEWWSETSVRCRTSHGARGTRRLVLTAGERAGTATEAWSTDLPMVIALTRTNRAGSLSGNSFPNAD